MSQETQTSFHEPEIYWIREDQQPQQSHFSTPAMLKRIVRVVQECCNPVIFTNVPIVNDVVDLPRPPTGLRSTSWLTKTGC